MTTKTAVSTQIPDSRISWIIALAVLVLSLFAAGAATWSRFNVDEDHINTQRADMTALAKTVSDTRDDTRETRDDVRWIKQALQQRQK